MNFKNVKELAKSNYKENCEGKQLTEDSVVNSFLAGYHYAINNKVFTKEEIAMLNETKDCLGELTSLADGYENDYVNFVNWLNKIKNK